jgi:hypothetical protein
LWFSPLSKSGGITLRLFELRLDAARTRQTGRETSSRRGQREGEALLTSEVKKKNKEIKKMIHRAAKAGLDIAGSDTESE